MKLYELIKNVKCRVFGSSLIEIDGIHHNHKTVKPNGLFFCIDGEKFRGLDFVDDAVVAGAVAIVTTKELCGLKGVTQIIVKNVRYTMSLIACNFYDNPAKKLKIIGVTGTNGKTTTTHMLSGLLDSLGKKSAVIGTNGVYYLDKKIDSGMTTPDPIELQKILAKLLNAGIEYVCMEVSAHAIYFNKVDGFNFEIMIFTNLTEDHLDFFKTMDNYFTAKKKIFNFNYVKTALINIDDEYGQELFNCIKINKFTYSIYNKSDYKADKVEHKNFKQRFYFNNQAVSSNFLGVFNVYNLISAIACLNLLKLKISDIQENIDKLKNVPGRVNQIVINKKLFIIDYAHTPDGLENILRLGMELKKSNKLISIFGCGGNRETQKRAKMGEISTRYADLTIITADNSRNESLDDIIKQIKEGCKNNKYIIIKNRGEAIKYAYQISKEKDVILVVGKGAENYLEVNNVKIPYSDFDEVEKLRKIDD